ncbi:MAG TPA: GNAT family N-acetyltransferase [Bdellovibrionales bacterium]|nr:GNAT family N-acetyltransferase [Bdellovibrionales bacterium]
MFQFQLSVSPEIILTEIQDSDKAAIIDGLQEKEIYRQTFSIPYPYGDAEADWFLARMREKRSSETKPTTLAIRLAKTNKLIGVFGFHDFEPSGHKAEIGYWLGKEHWGSGILTKVTGKAVEYAFSELGVTRIFAKVFSRNKASIRVLQKVGFQHEGLLRNDSMKDGELLDVDLFGLLKNEYRAMGSELVMINGLDNIYYFVTDVKKSAEFYRDVLGLKILDQDDYWATVDLHGVRLGLHKASTTEFSKSAERRSGATVTMNVSDIDKAYDFYKSRGVKFLGPVSKNSWGSHVSFTDPDGNLLDLREAPKK